METMVDVTKLRSVDAVTSPALTDGWWESHVEKADKEFNLQEAIELFCYGNRVKATEAEVQEFIKACGGY